MRITNEKSKRMKKLFTVLLSGVLALTVAACGTTSATEGNGGENVSEDGSVIYTSFYPMYEFTSEIVGDTAEVVNIMPPGSASHGWEPTARQIAELTEAEVLVFQGAGMEEWVESVRATLEGEGSSLTWIEATEGLELRDGHSHDHDHGDEDYDHDHDHGDENHDHDHDHDHGDEDHDHDHDHDHSHATDPHVWLSVNKSIQMIENIRNALSELFPENAEIYSANAAAYTEELEALASEFESSLSEANIDSFMINHEAFGYLADDYGLTQHGISGMGTEQDPNPERMGELVRIIEEEGYSAIFYDDAGSEKIVETLAAEVGDIEVLPLTTMHSPSEEELSEGNDYITLMRRNLENLLASAN